MNINNCLIFAITFFCSFLTHAEFLCEGQRSSALHPSQLANTGNSLEIDGGNRSGTWTSDFGAGKYLSSFDLIKCRSTTSLNLSYGSSKTASYNAFASGSMIDQNQDISLSGLKYFKLVNTNNAFLNNYAYISFFYVGANIGGSRYWLNYPDYLIQSESTNLSQGVRFNEIRFLFTGVPTQPILNIPLNIGALTVSMKESLSSSKFTTTSQSVQIWLNISAAPLKTCTIQNQTVQLPIILTSDFNVGVAGTANKGDKSFTITANCKSLGQSLPLTAKFIDNYDIQNSSSVLKNSNTNSNIGIKIYNDSQSDKSEISLNSNFTFGTTQATQNEQTLNRSFKAVYFKNDTNTAIAGLVNSQSIISINYP